MQPPLPSDAVNLRHLRYQGPVIRALGKAVAQGLRGAEGKSAPETPGAEVVATIPPRPRDLVGDYVRHLGVSPRAWGNTLPPHLFPQWTFPIAAKTLADLPYPLVKILNGGCRLEVNAPLPVDAPLRVRARLESIDDDGRRAVRRQRVVPENDELPDALVAYIHSVVVHGKGKGQGEGKRKKKERVRVPVEATEIHRWRLGPAAARDFAALTGDVNPVHWLAPYARAFGFRGTILHGFATFARTWESLCTKWLCNDRSVLRHLELRFTRPLVLPARVGVFRGEGNTLAIGRAPGAPAYASGDFSLDTEN